MRHHVLLITSSNLASNPRCLKEIQLLSSMDIDISLVAFKFHNWRDKHEAIINKEFSHVKFHYLDATKNDLGAWFFSTLSQKISIIISPLFPNNIFFNSVIFSKRSSILINWLKRCEEKPDVIIAHNPATFYPAWLFSKRIKARLAIDIEDFHPGEGENTKVSKRLTSIMKFILPKAAYVSFASPLIKKYTDEMLENESANGVVINNSFPENEFIAPVVQENEKLKLAWFSQYIDYHRGLENILPALDVFGDKLELTLIGDLRQDFYNKEIKSRNYIICIPSLLQKDLHTSLSRYDIGLAIENKEVDTNRDICLTNKIWAYFQAGLFILASDTKAQELFINDHEEHGVCITLEKSSIEKEIETLLKNIEIIRSGSQVRFQNAKEYCWENESLPLRNNLNRLLSQ